MANQHVLFMMNYFKDDFDDLARLIELSSAINAKRLGIRFNAREDGLKELPTEYYVMADADDGLRKLINDKKREIGKSIVEWLLLAATMDAAETARKSSDAAVEKD